MPALIRQPAAELPQQRPIAWGIAALLSIVALAALGRQYGFDDWPRAFLHGLCAQRESHSFRFGDRVLPVDARMTGIYLGAATTIGWLAAAGRLRMTGKPRIATIAILALFCLTMAVDGFNALLVDLAMPYPYEPSNPLRFVTGTLAGSALGVGVAFLFATSIWRSPIRAGNMVNAPHALAVPLLATGAIGIPAMSGMPVFYGPLVIALIVSAIAVFWMFSVTLAALLSGKAWTYEKPNELGTIGIVGLLVGVALIAAFAGFRYLAESAWGLPQLS